MVGRGAQGNPWALREILDGDDEPSREEVAAELILFVRETVRELGERRASGFLKKFYGWYLGRGRFHRSLKQELVRLETTDDVVERPARRPRQAPPRCWSGWRPSSRTWTTRCSSCPSRSTAAARNAMKGASSVAASGLSPRCYREEARRNVACWFGSESEASRRSRPRRAGADGRVDAVPPDADGLRMLARRFAGEDGAGGGRVDERRPLRPRPARARPVGRSRSPTRPRSRGWRRWPVKTDRIDARVLAELCWRDLVPAVWLPDPEVRGERERARFRLHLVRHRTALKNRVHATLLAHRRPLPGRRPVRRLRPAAARAAAAARALGRRRRRQPAPDRRARPGDRRLRARAAPARRRPPLRAAAD